MMKSEKQQRYLSLITEYILYIHGNDNVVADCLSSLITAYAVTVDLCVE